MWCAEREGFLPCSCIWISVSAVVSNKYNRYLGTLQDQSKRWRISRNWRKGWGAFWASGPSGPLRSGKREIRPLGITTLTLWWITLNLDERLVKIFRLQPGSPSLPLVGDMLHSHPIISHATPSETLSANQNPQKLLVHDRMKWKQATRQRNTTRRPCQHPSLPCPCTWISKYWGLGRVWDDPVIIFFTSRIAQFSLHQQN